MTCIRKAVCAAVACCCLTGTISAQSIAMKMSNVTVKQAMDELEKKSGYSFVFSSQDLDTQKRISVSADNDDVRTVRYTDQSAGLLVSFSSTDSFSLSEERVTQSQYTSIGQEKFGLYTRIDVSFPISLAKGEARLYRLIARAADTSSKERE